MVALKWLVAFAAMLIAFNAQALQPPLWCVEGTGNATAGCTPTDLTRLASATRDREAFRAAFPATHNGATLNCPNVLNVGAYTGNARVQWSTICNYVNTAGNTISETLLNYIIPVCPLVNGTRALPSGTVEATACPGAPPDPVCSPLAGTGINSSKQFDLGVLTLATMRGLPGTNRFACDPIGCKVEGKVTDCAFLSASTNTLCFISFPKFTGEVCDPAADPGGAPYAVADPDPPAGVCPKGTCPGTINGVQTCVPCSDSASVATATSTSSTTSGTGTSTVTTTSTVVTTTKTVCSGADCTTSVVTTTPTSTATTTATVPKEAFCKENPKHPSCAEAGTFGGVCGAFTCTGDAVQCATAKAINESKCLLDPGTGLDAVKTALAGGTFGTALQVRNKVVGQFDQTNPLGNASCPADQTLNLLGAQVVIPLATACPSLQAMGNLIVAFALIAATIFVVKGF